MMRFVCMPKMCSHVPTNLGRNLKIEKQICSFIKLRLYCNPSANVKVYGRLYLAHSAHVAKRQLSKAFAALTSCHLEEWTSLYTG